MNGPLYGLFGGTFDPVHNGHLQTVLEVFHACQLQEVCWIPAGIPGHRQRPFASAADRCRMVNLAIADYPQFSVSDIEIARNKVCYTLNTVTALKAVHPRRVFCFILGLDSLLKLETWHRWTELLNSMHIIVMNRPGLTMPNPLPDWWQNAQTDSMDALLNTPSGHIFWPDITPCPISSSDIRHCLVNKIDISHLVPPAVDEYIRTCKLYGYDSG